VENFILNVKREHTSWGARKIRERLIRRFSGIPIPAKSTIHAVLDRYGLVERRGRLRRRAQGTALSLGQKPNELWCTDYKGEFLLGNHHYCYPLTVTDHASRFLLTCEALSSTRENYAFPVFERLFRERGLPANIRSDNGVPFASAHALFNLSKLAVWWLRLGIGIERIQPGHPQQNGRHERMHLTLKKEATKPAAANFLQQQARFDKFIEVFNHKRPHAALDMNARPRSISLPRVPTPDCPTSIIPSTTKPSWSRAAAASVWETKRLTSARFLPVRPSASKKCTTISGWSALWIMIWDISIWRLGCSNHSKTRSAQKCYLLDCTPKLRQQETLHFAAKGLQSAEEEKERAVYAGVPAVCCRTNESSSQFLRVSPGIGGPAGTPVPLAATTGSAVVAVDRYGRELYPAR
jgi:transposase InsO family protein